MLLPASGCLAAILLLLLARLAHSPTHPLSEALSVCLLALGTYLPCSESHSPSSLRLDTLLLLLLLVTSSCP
jgi:hypothetical protein